MGAQRIARRRIVGTLALAFALGGIPLGFTPIAALAQGTQAAPAVTAPIRLLDEGLLSVMRAGESTKFSTRVQLLTPSIDAALNLPTILREAVGPNWSTLSPTQQAQLLAVFRQYTVASFVQNFDSYDGQKITISPHTRPLSNGGQVVSTVITSANGRNTHTIDYVMRKDTSGTWKATDVLADGTISRVAVLRSDFADMLAHGGAPALVASLQQKTEKLENG